MSNILEELRENAKLEGFVPETEAFERRLRQLQVSKCREIRGVISCTECAVFDYCELTKRVMRDYREVTTEGESRET